MKKDKLYFLTFLSIAVIFLLVALIASQYFIKVSANQLIEVQVESSKRETNEVSKLIAFQFLSGIKKEEIIGNLQKTIETSNTDTWFISVFNWGGKEVCHPDKTKVGQQVNSNERLISSKFLNVMYLMPFTYPISCVLRQKSVEIDKLFSC